MNSSFVTPYQDAEAFQAVAPTPPLQAPITCGLGEPGRNGALHALWEAGGVEPTSAVGGGFNRSAANSMVGKEILDNTAHAGSGSACGIRPLPP